MNEVKFYLNVTQHSRPSVEDYVQTYYRVMARQITRCNAMLST